LLVQQANFDKKRANFRHIFLVIVLLVSTLFETMATIKIHLDKRREKKDGTFPLVIRIRHFNHYFDIPTSINLNESEFDSKKALIKGNSKLSNDLQHQKNKIYIKFHDLMRDGLTFEEIKFKMLNKRLPQKSLTIESFWIDEIKRMTSSGRAGGARVYLSSLQGLSSVVDLSISFKELKYKSLITADEELRKKGLSTNSIGVYMRCLRAICNKAIKLDIVDFTWYPFRKYQIKRERTVPRTLSIEEMQKYFSVSLPLTHKWFKSYCIGMLIFQLRGINLKDLLMLTNKNIKNNRIVYKRAKTGKLYSIELLPETKQLLEFFNGKNTLLGFLDEVFDNLHNQLESVDRYSQCRKNINAHLMQIGQQLNLSIPLSTYVFRYSYANIAKQLGYSKDVIAEALGHEYGNSVTGIYLEMFDNQKLDEMNNKIVERVSNL
jgi:integrase